MSSTYCLRWSFPYLSANITHTQQMYSINVLYTAHLWNIFRDLLFRPHVFLVPSFLSVYHAINQCQITLTISRYERWEGHQVAANGQMPHSLAQRLYCWLLRYPFHLNYSSPFIHSYALYIYIFEGRMTPCRQVYGRIDWQKSTTFQKKKLK